MSNTINKLEDLVTGHHDNSVTTTDTRSTGAHGTHSTTQPNTSTGRTAGPHRSDMANRADRMSFGSCVPSIFNWVGTESAFIARVDSDRDYRGNPVGGTGVGGMGSAHTSGSTNYGPHDSSTMNKVDPRVGFDGDERSGFTGTHGAHGATGVGSTGTYTDTTGNDTSANVGPHDSNIMNKLDPRVDSDRDGRAGLGSTTCGKPGTTGMGSTAQGTPGVAGVSTGAYGAMPGGASHTAAYPGPAPKTAGPHKSDMMNKLDPRVDSDLDGSKIFGADKTHAAGTGTGAAGSTHY
ncbi:unnamed protein product [Tuber aestivum]|uniref:Uncharacterized protein n=1 Tax=Tuber aestivum TaxID=59557 RepID=A0A292PLK8_9PEZI|nr:unnamed protein product [Tuber aestivum]